MYLPDRGGRHRLLTEPCEHLLGRSTKIGAQHVFGQVRIHRRRISLEPSQRFLIGPKSAVANGTGIHHGQQLTRLHHHAFGVPKKVGIPLGGSIVKALPSTSVATLLS